ncbi:MAG: MBL fold metallo-hydrolase [bacterium]
MLTELTASRYTVRGASLGGMYTSLHVPELDALFDVGYPLRGGCAASHLFLSHAHIDHLGALPTVIGMRGLSGVQKTLRVFLPAGLEGELQASLDALSRLHRWPLAIEAVPMAPGQEIALRKDLIVRAFRTIHSVTSLGYLFLRRVPKLRAEFADLPGPEIGRRRRAGEDLFEQLDHLELAYATDTLPEVLDRVPELLEARTLILECTFLDDRKSIEAARAGCHIHLDQLLPYEARLKNEALVLMHFSQLYKPSEVLKILDNRWPAASRGRVHALVPDADHWWS